MLESECFGIACSVLQATFRLPHVHRLGSWAEGLGSVIAYGA
jgi:hypothetical protein